MKNISPTSITISVANVAGEGDWWCSYDGGNNDWTSMKEGWNDSIGGYETTVTDSDTISYFTENGIKIGMLSGLSAKVTVTVAKSETASDNESGDAENEETGEIETTE